MKQLKQHLVALLGAAMMAAGLLAVATVPVSAACSGLGIQLYDGSGHYYTFPTTGTCSDPFFAVGNLRNYAATCIGNFGINQGSENDCVNQVRFYGNWPSNFAITAYQDIGWDGRIDGFFRFQCAQQVWHTLSHVDEMSSFIVAGTSIQCT